MIASVIFNIRYFAVGNISILAPATKNNLKLLIEGNILTIHDGTVAYTDSDGNKWRRAAVIKYTHIEKDEQGEEQIEAQGYTLSYWLDKRVISCFISWYLELLQQIHRKIRHNRTSIK